MEAQIMTILRAQKCAGLEIIVGRKRFTELIARRSENPPYFWERRAIRPSNRNPRLDTYRPIVLKLSSISVIDPEIYGMPKVSLFRFSDIKKKIFLI